jgi:hypothetical protein
MKIGSFPTFEKYQKAVLTHEGDEEGTRQAFDQVTETLPSEYHLADEHNPPRWSMFIRPRDEWYLTSDLQIGWNYTAEGGSMMVLRNVTYNMNMSIPHVYPNTMPERPGLDSSITPWRLAYNDKSFPATDIERHGKCLPRDDYVWGFSSLILFTFCMITVAVAILLIILHYDAYFNSAADRYKLSISPYRDLLDLAEELRAHYGAAATADMPAKELDRAMREDPVVTGLETDTLHRSRRARWKQAKASKKSFSRNDAWKRSKVAEGRAATDAEESLMSMGFDAQLQSEMEMAKLPPRVASRSTNGM